MNQKILYQRFPIALSGVILACNLVLIGQLVGFSQALSAEASPPRVLTRVVFAQHLGGSVTDTFVLGYIGISVCVGVFGVMKYLEKNPLIRNVSSVPLIVAIIIYASIIHWKYIYLEENNGFGYSYWILNSISADYLCLILVLLLLAVQVISVAINIGAENQADSS